MPWSCAVSWRTRVTIFHGSSDTEVICYLITRNRLRMGSIETAQVSKDHGMCWRVHTVW